MLNDRMRVTLFWFTIAMIAVVAIVAVITILQTCGGPMPAEPPPPISPSEVTLCPGAQQQFTLEGEAEVIWQATGGTVNQSGLFVAGGVPGDYTVSAARSESGPATEATVHVVTCTPVPTRTPVPTVAPSPTPTPEPTPIPPADPQGDVTAYESGAPIEAPPPGLDIRAASAADDLKVVLQPIAGVPEALTGWAGENDVLLWISLYEPVPTSLAVYTDWLFVLDLDGDTTTGRPAGSARINPDLGTEAALGVSFNATAGQYEPYFWVWDPAQDDWTEVAGVSRFIIDDSRTIVGLAVPLETLTRSVAETTGVTVAPEAVKGRAAALTFVGDQAVIDFYPDRPQ